MFDDNKRHETKPIVKTQHDGVRVRQKEFLWYFDRYFYEKLIQFDCW
jgi:hypothetical protein